MRVDLHDPEVISTVTRAAASFPSDLRDDLIQEGCLEVLRAAERIEPEHLGYVYRVAHNAMLGYLRRTQGQRVNKQGVPSARWWVEYTKTSIDELNDALTDAESHLLATGDPEEEALARIELERVLSLVARLPQRARCALLADIRGQTLIELAEALGVHTETLVDDRRVTRALLRGRRPPKGKTIPKLAPQESRASSRMVS